MCLCIYKIYILYLQRLSCHFCEKVEKTAELVFSTPPNFTTEKYMNPLLKEFLVVRKDLL